MEIGARNLAAKHSLYVLNAVEALADSREKGRNRFLSCRDACEEELLYPKPCRPQLGLNFPSSIGYCKPLNKFKGTGEAGEEILEILCNKTNCGDSLVYGDPSQNFTGSPPSRSSNPIIHDVHFQRKTACSMSIPQKPSCSSSISGSTSAKSNSSCKSLCGTSSFASKPFIRIEGFASSKADSNMGVPAYA